MMKNYTKNFIPNIVGDSVSTIKRNKHEIIQLKNRNSKSTIREHFSSGNFSSNFKRIRDNFQLRGNRRILDVESSISVNPVQS
mmetsp:Transcript_30860/g.30407  ORF Transcript_30860/g.30407 Transcript_30860/m.30407 type:complete len:83 (+) Transcript_30860:582-830(+)